MALAVAANTPAGQELDVFVRNDQRLAVETLDCAKILTSRMFASADIAVHWHNWPHTGERNPYRTIIVQLKQNTPDGFHPGALALTKPFEGVHITIFYDRIQRMDLPSLTCRLVAHVMVHEITHLLMGIERHSATGVMKARWSWDDFYQMKQHPLPFEPEDVAAIRRSEQHLGSGSNIR